MLNKLAISTFVKLNYLIEDISFNEIQRYVLANLEGLYVDVYDINTKVWKFVDKNRFLDVENAEKTKKSFVPVSYSNIVSKNTSNSKLKKDIQVPDPNANKENIVDKTNSSQEILKHRVLKLQRTRPDLIDTTRLTMREFLEFGFRISLDENSQWDTIVCIHKPEDSKPGYCEMLSTIEKLTECLDYLFATLFDVVDEMEIFLTAKNKYGNLALQFPKMEIEEESLDGYYGMYNPPRNTITLYVKNIYNNKNKNLLATFLHEMNHFISYNKAKEHRGNSNKYRYFNTKRLNSERYDTTISWEEREEEIQADVYAALQAFGVRGIASSIHFHEPELKKDFIQYYNSENPLDFENWVETTVATKIYAQIIKFLKSYRNGNTWTIKNPVVLKVVTDFIMANKRDIYLRLVDLKRETRKKDYEQNPVSTFDYAEYQ